VDAPFANSFPSVHDKNAIYSISEIIFRIALIVNQKTLCAAKSNALGTVLFQAEGERFRCIIFRAQPKISPLLE